MASEDDTFKRFYQKAADKQPDIVPKERLENLEETLFDDELINDGPSSIAAMLYDEDKFEDALKILADTQETYYTNLIAGLCDLHLLHYSDAEKKLLHSLELLPEQFDAWYGLGQLYADTFRPIEAKNAYSNALKYDPDDVVTLFNYAAVLISLNETQEAYEALKKARSLDPEDPYVTINLCSIIEGLGHPRICQWLLAKAFRKHPSDSDVLYYYAHICWVTGDEPMFCELREMLKVIDPERAEELRKHLGLDM